MTTLEILVGARELIATPEKWTKGYFALGKFERLPTLDEIATGKGDDIHCYCIEGALVRAGGARYPRAAYMAMGFVDLEDMNNWNDSPFRTHSEVLSRLDAAIEAERKKI